MKKYGIFRHQTGTLHTVLQQWYMSQESRDRLIEQNSHVLADEADDYSEAIRLRDLYDTVAEVLLG